MATFNPRIVKSRSTDPFYNLTYEEMLLQTLGENDVVLLLWQNESSVILGRNQNVWRECRLKELELSTGSIVRRRSGGGAVFHDLGNINFFIYNPSEKLQPTFTNGHCYKSFETLGY